MLPCPLPLRDRDVDGIGTFRGAGGVSDGPGNRLQYKRVNGPFTLYMVAGGGTSPDYNVIVRRTIERYRTLVQESPRVHHRAHDSRAIRTLSVLDEFTRESLAIRTEKQLVALT